MRIAPIVALLSLLAAGAEAIEPHDQPRALDVRVLPIGQGSCVLVGLPGGEDALLVDCGSVRGPLGRLRGASGTAADAVADAVVGRDRLHVVETHGHPDHVNQIGRVVRALPPGTAVATRLTYDALPEPHSDADTGTPTLRLGPADDPVAVWVLTANTVDVDPAVACPETDTIPRANPDTRNLRSVVLLLAWRDVRVVLPGDAECATEAAALGALARLEGSGRVAPRTEATAVLLVGPHHGSHTAGSNSVEFARALAPTHVIWSAGRSGNGHPRCEAVDRYVPSLDAAEPHPFRCVDRLFPERVGRATTDRAEWVTEASGGVSARTQGAGWSVVADGRD